ncbi:MAG: hypothetical protein HY717_03805 [Planctomycetes bacterium]|nr:hypothetical protein [Planctomycetota bacterium]
MTSGQVQVDIIATVNHEIKHLQQHVAVRDNHFGRHNGSLDLNEAEGHHSELLDPSVSWRHQLFEMKHPGPPIS